MSQHLSRRDKPRSQESRMTPHGALENAISEPIGRLHSRGTVSDKKMKRSGQSVDPLDNEQQEKRDFAALSDSALSRWKKEKRERGVPHPVHSAVRANRRSSFGFCRRLSALTLRPHRANPWRELEALMESWRERDACGDGREKTPLSSSSSPSSGFPICSPIQQGKQTKDRLTFAPCGTKSLSRLQFHVPLHSPAMFDKRRHSPAMIAHRRSPGNWKQNLKIFGITSAPCNEGAVAELEKESCTVQKIPK